MFVRKLKMKIIKYSIKKTVFGVDGIVGSLWYPGCRTGERQALAMHDNYFFFAGTGLFNNSMGDV